MNETSRAGASPPWLGSNKSGEEMTMTTRRRASHHYELSDRRTGMTWTRRREAIRAARMSGASAVYVVRYPRVGRIATGTARTIVWRA